MPTNTTPWEGTGLNPNLQFNPPEQNIAPPPSTPTIPPTTPPPQSPQGTPPSTTPALDQNSPEAQAFHTTNPGLEYTPEDQWYGDQAQTISDAQHQQELLNQQYDTAFNNFQNTLTQYQNGSIPLTTGEQAQIDGLKQQYQALIDQQKLTNTGAAGVANIRGYQTGAAEYDPTFQAKTIGSITAAGIQKVADLNTKMASVVASMTQAFQDNDIAIIKEKWNEYKDYEKQRSDSIQKTIDDTQKKIKEAQDLAQKEQERLDKVVKDVNQVALDAAKNGASPEVIKAIGQATSVSEAIEMAGDSLQTATGDMGEYLFYKRDATSRGQVPVSWETWKKMKDKEEINKEYNKAYAGAKGKAAGELVGSGGTTNFKPLTEAQGKDLTYAQRGDQAKSTIDSLETDIMNMNSAEYRAQIGLESGVITRPFSSPVIKQIRQAERNFLTAVLRRESGAQISDTEFATGEKQYFPMPGDDAATLAQKKATRDLAIASFKQNVPQYQERIAQTPSNQLLTASAAAKTAIDNFYVTAAPDIQKKVKEMQATGASDIDIYNNLKARGLI